MIRKTIQTRLQDLEKRCEPTNQELIDFITRTEPLPGDKALGERIERAAPAYIRRMTNAELIALITG